VLQLPGAHHFVFHKGEPATVDMDDIETLRKMLKMRSESVEIRENAALTKGNFVNVIAGPLAGQRLEVEKRKNKIAVFLRFPTMNQVLITEVRIEDISWEESKL
jgi:transcription antitermination factor NusG